MNGPGAILFLVLLAVIGGLAAYGASTLWQEVRAFFTAPADLEALGREHARAIQAELDMRDVFDTARRRLHQVMRDGF
jgi:cytochrome c-type biogenesis protein CcmH/NrfG